MAIDINIPIENAVTDGSLNPVTSNAVFDGLALKANSADLATVATSGDYNDLSNLPSIPSGTVTSVGLTMPSAFTVANSPITSSGDIAVTGAGVASQYVRGDGSLANFPASTGGGASLSFYLNGSVSQGTFGGVAFEEMNRTPILGLGTNFTLTNTNNYIASFLTDANDPNQLNIPAGNWNCELYFNVSNNSGNPSFYIELYKYDGVTFTLIASSSTNPEFITNGTQVDLYTTAIPVPQTTLLATDRLAVRVHVNTSGNRSVTLHTEDNNLCQVITTFSTGLNALNGITAQVQNLATGTSGSDFAINSTGSTHTFNLPTASAANRGALSTADWTTFNSKQAALVSGTNIKTVNGNSLLGSGDLVVGGGITVGTTAVTSGTVGRVFFQGAGNVVQQSSSLFWDNTNSRLGVGATPATSVRLDVRAQGALSTDIALRVRNSADTANIISVRGDNKLQFGSSAANWIQNDGDFQLGSFVNYSTLLGWFGGAIPYQYQGATNTSMLRTNSNQNVKFVSAAGGATNGILNNFGTSNIALTDANLVFNGTKTFTFENGTAPTLSYTDSFQQYSADITAGNAAPHFRTENGNIIKLYQQSSAGITTVGQLVTVLQNLGLLS
jgi:hypothetical protein